MIFFHLYINWVKMHVHACGLHTRDCPWRSSPSCWTRRQGGESRVAYSESSGYWLPIGRSYSCAWYINNDILGKYSVTVTIMFIWRHDNKNLSLQWGHVSVTKWNNYSCVKLHMKTWVIMISNGIDSNLRPVSHTLHDVSARMRDWSWWGYM